MRRPFLLRAMALALSGLLLLAGSVARATDSFAGDARAEPVGEQRPEQVCVPAARADYCPKLCAPVKMVFLPCMAVGAPAMAACREREMDACRTACEERASAVC